MPQIYITAFAATTLAVLIIGGIVFARAARGDRLFLLALFACVLPMSPAAWFGVRIPLDGLLVAWLGKGDGFYRFLTTFYAPLTEEPAKLWPLLLPWVTARLKRENAVSAAIALGLGFGVGEIWFLAYQIARLPAYAGIPWYQFLGFLNERILVCFMHGAFTAAALVRWDRRFALGVLVAVALHYAGNFPIYLAGFNPWGWDKKTWQIILVYWVVAYAVAMIILLGILAFGRKGVGRFFYGRARCPECGTLYPRPLFGVNLVTVRYERCPSCRKWHVTTTYKEPPAAACPPGASTR